MKFVIKSRPFRHLAQGAADTALDAASVLREGAAAVGRQGEAAYSRLRLEREIHDLQEEINLQLLAVGESIYAATGGAPPTADRYSRYWSMWTACGRSWKPTGGRGTPSEGC